MRVPAAEAASPPAAWAASEAHFAAVNVSRDRSRASVDLASVVGRIDVVPCKACMRAAPANASTVPSAMHNVVSSTILSGSIALAWRTTRRSCGLERVECRFACSIPVMGKRRGFAWPS
jgi:hypothetical protein